MSVHSASAPEGPEIVFRTKSQIDQIDGRNRTVTVNGHTFDVILKNKKGAVENPTSKAFTEFVNTLLNNSPNLLRALGKGAASVGVEKVTLGEGGRPVLARRVKKLSGREYTVKTVNDKLTEAQAKRIEDCFKEIFHSRRSEPPAHALPEARRRSRSRLLSQEPGLGRGRKLERPSHSRSRERSRFEELRRASARQSSSSRPDPDAAGSSSASRSRSSPSRYDSDKARSRSSSHVPAPADRSSRSQRRNRDEAHPSSSSSSSGTRTSSSSASSPLNKPEELRTPRDRQQVAEESSRVIDKRTRELDAQLLPNRTRAKEAWKSPDPSKASSHAAQKEQPLAQSKPPSIPNSLVFSDSKDSPPPKAVSKKSSKPSKPSSVSHKPPSSRSSSSRPASSSKSKRSDVEPEPKGRNPVKRSSPPEVRQPHKKSENTPLPKVTTEFWDAEDLDVMNEIDQAISDEPGSSGRFKQAPTDAESPKPNKGWNPFRKAEKEAKPTSKSRHDVGHDDMRAENEEPRPKAKKA